MSLDFRRFDTKFYLSRKEVDSGLDFFTTVSPTPKNTVRTVSTSKIEKKIFDFFWPQDPKTPLDPHFPLVPPLCRAYVAIFDRDSVATHTRQCRGGVEGVSRHCRDTRDTVETLSRHIRDTVETVSRHCRGCVETLSRHILDTVATPKRDTVETQNATLSRHCHCYVSTLSRHRLTASTRHCRAIPRHCRDFVLEKKKEKKNFCLRKKKKKKKILS